MPFKLGEIKSGIRITNYKVLLTIASLHYSDAKFALAIESHKIEVKMEGGFDEVALHKH
jgi:hypothetical protein